MKVLSIEQMNKLKELGVDVKPKGTCLMYTSDSSDCYYLKYGESTCEDDVAAFGLQDVVELLPNTLPHQLLSPTLRITKNSVDYVDSSFFGNIFIEHSEYDEKEDILNAAYNMLILVIKNGYLKTK